MRLGIAVGFALFAATPTSAEIYSVYAKRESSNVYVLDRGKAYALTKRCYVYAFSEEAIVDWSGRGGQIMFKSSKEICELDKLLFKMDLDAGDYRVSLTREMDGFYRADLGGIYFKASYCYEYSYADDAILTWDGFKGVIFFKGSKQTCDVESIWSAA